MKHLLLAFFTLLCLTANADNWPDGSKMDKWFSNTSKVDIKTLGKQFVVTDYGVKQDSTIIQTSEIQAVIDRCSSEGGGVVVIPKGTFLTGALFFKPGTHLHFIDGAKLKGIDAIKHYLLINMHMEGQNIKYFSALINAIGVDGFTITGNGTIDGNGRRFWEEFWLRRQWNRKCTNLEALRPQLLYVSGSNDVIIQDMRLVDSGYWTNHLYRCKRIKFLDCYIESPTQGETRAPSSDGIDLDVCEDVLVKGCYINVCDDGVCIKGGRGTYVDKDSTAGPVSRVLVEGCRFGHYTNAGITFGSEAWNVHNVVMRDCKFEGSYHMLLFKMRTDTPQSYEDVRMERCTGYAKRAIEISSWSQFHALEKRPDMPVSHVSNVTIKDLSVKADNFFVVNHKHPFNISNFKLENIVAEDKANEFDISEIKDLQVNNVTLNGEKKSK